MKAYKKYANIDSEGKLVLENLPFKNQKRVEVVLLINDSDSLVDQVEEKLNRLKASFGSIKSSTRIPDNALSRDELYTDEGR